MTMQTTSSRITATAAQGGIDLMALRLKRGLSGAEVARRLGVTPQAYAGFEKGCRAGKLSLGRFREILGILGCEIDIRGPTTEAAIVKAPESRASAWEMPEHYATLPCDFDTDETLEAWARSRDLSDPLPTPAVIENVWRGLEWAFKRPLSWSTLFTVAYACRLHQKMFGGVFRDAGIVKPRWQFPGAGECKATSRLRGALEAAAAGLASERPLVNVAIDLHHALAADAAFAQGSAAHARAMADLVLVRSGAERFTWGLRLGLDPIERTERYRNGFRCKHRMPQLAREAIAFARS